MSRFKNTMEIFLLLDKSNCRDCHLPTCLAFAAAVFKGQKQLNECPRLPRDIIERFGAGITPPDGVAAEGDVQTKQLQEKIGSIDLAAAAKRLGARFSDNKLTLKVLGKDFSVDAKGNLSSDIHIHSWVAIPALSHILEGSGISPSGKWVPFRELKNGRTWQRLFAQRCEKPIKRVADIYPDLFEDIVRIFNGRPVENHYDADIALVLHPLPKVPILISYTKPEDGFESDLNMFFDATAEKNLNIESIFALGTGLARMFEKIAFRHGFR
ncbi:MAG: DUF3786 domain-containing protein [Desulfobacterales bacterium]|nr:DUF3786 domain-containing protein [Desulfobacterales bacterium]